MNVKVMLYMMTCSIVAFDSSESEEVKEVFFSSSTLRKFRSVSHRFTSLSLLKSSHSFHAKAMVRAS